MKLEQQLKLLEKNGFVLIPDIISDAECHSYKKLLEEDYIKYS